MKTITTLIFAFVASACMAQSNKELTNKQKEPEALPAVKTPPQPVGYALYMNHNEAQNQIQISQLLKTAIPYAPANVIPDDYKITILKNLDVNIAFLQANLRPVFADTSKKVLVPIKKKN